VLSGNAAISKLLMDCFETLAADHPEHEFIFIAEKEFAEKKINFKNVKHLVLPQQTSNALLWQLWYNYKLPSALKKISATILVNADGACSLRTKVPQCLLVNNLALNYPGWYSKNYLRFIKSNSARFMGKAKTIVTFSHVLKNEFVKRYGAEENKIMVIPPTSGKQYQPLNWEAKEKLKEKYSGGKEYFLFNGTVHPANKLMNLLKAFSLFKKRQKSNMQLIIASQSISEDNAFVESIQSYKYRDEIKLMTDLDENTIKEITSAAYACINTSVLQNEMVELLHAMESEVPVLAGNFHVAIEIFGDAALYINPDSPENIAEHLMDLYKDENKRNELVKKGLEQSSKYNLKNTAGQFWQSILATTAPA